MKDLRDEVNKPKKLKAKDPIKQILDEENNENVVLFDADNNPIEFEQIALIPMDVEGVEKLYAILIPITPMQGVSDGEGVLFELDEAKGSLDVVNDQAIIDSVLEIYEKLLNDSDDDGKKDK